MTGRHAPAPTYPSRLWLGLMAAAVTGIVAGTVAVAHATAPRVAADERLSLTPKNSPEPVAHGGPLVLPSIGAVVSDPVAYLPPVERTTNPLRSPVPPTRTRTANASNPASQAATEALTATATPSEPTVVSQTQAATTTPTVTAATTEAATTTTEATTTTADTTSETATATVSVTVSATETTEEGQ